MTRADRKALRELERAGQPKAREARGLPRWGRWGGTLFAGQPGKYPGRVPWEIRIPRQIESTAATRGLYPWLAGRPLPARGPIFGREILSGGLWHIDPWEHRKLQRVGDCGIFISGVIGSGKSAAAKSLVLRHGGFGRPFVVPADLRGEWVPVAEAVGGKVMRLGPGMPERLNALAMPALPPGQDPRIWWLTVRTHWQELLENLGRTILEDERALTPEEKTGIEVALTEATGYDEASGQLDRLRPITLHSVVDMLRNPTQRMADVVGMPVDELRHTLRPLGLSLRQLTEGALQGLVDGEGQGDLIDPSRPATVVDISRVQTSDAAIALVMACTQSVIELAFVHQVQQWWIVYDELWRLMRFAALLRRLDGGQRRSRGSGAGTILLSHRVTDAQLGGEEARRAAADLIADCATKIIYRQRADTIAGTLEMVTLTDMIAAQLPTLPRGRAVHVVDGEPFLVDHLLPPKLPGEPATDPVTGRTLYRDEWDVIETDQVLSDSYRTLAGVEDDVLFDGVR
ncbi:YbaK/EbsC family protein [Nakamurella lactea]|uniref:hypothetical protein n=1 Tax=Nakamurella lactea TaxID=459515 RepID=UPI001B7FE6E2|nr:hypothetical protein [Nakamurella lactea]